MKNNFNLKGISNLLGPFKEIISADVYGDTKEIIADCLDVLQPFIEEVLPDTKKSKKDEQVFKIFVAMPVVICYNMREDKSERQIK